MQKKKDIAHDVTTTSSSTQSASVTRCLQKKKRCTAPSGAAHSIRTALSAAGKRKKEKEKDKTMSDEMFMEIINKLDAHLTKMERLPDIKQSILKRVKKGCRQAKAVAVRRGEEARAAGLDHSFEIVERCNSMIKRARVL